MTTSSSKTLTDKGTIDEGQGAYGITDMQIFQAWLFELRQGGEDLADLSTSVQMIVFNGGRTITFWDIGEVK